jgi:hypothetical protein
MERSLLAYRKLWMVGCSLFDDVVDCLVMFEVVLDGVAEKFCFAVLLEDGVVDAELEGLVVLRIEDGVVGFGWVRDEVVVVKVGDEAGEFGLG